MKPTAGKRMLIGCLLLMMFCHGFADNNRALILMDAETGRILRMENPGAAVETSFTPGSIIKIFSALYGLKQNIIQPDRIIYCNGSITIAGKTLTCNKPTGHGSVNLYNALALSCDTWFFHYGQQINADDYLQFLKQTGFGSKTGLDTQLEEPGILPLKLNAQEKLSLFTGSSRKLEITPLQAAAALAAVANGGRLLQPITGPVETPYVRQDLEITAFLPAITRGLKLGAGFGGNAYSASHGWFTGWFPVPLAAGTRKVVLVIFTLNPTRNQDTAATALQETRSFLNRALDRQQVTVTLYSLLNPKTLTVKGRIAKLGVRTGKEDIACNSLKLGITADGNLKLAMDNQKPRTVKRIRIGANNINGGLFIDAGTATPRDYDGWLTVEARNKRLHVVNSLSIKSYLEGVIGNEMGKRPEALKSQAVASRTYALKNLQRHAPYDFCDTTHCQYYTGRIALTEPVKEAVKLTSGLVVTTYNQLCDVYYFSTCGGQTNSSEGVWGKPAVSYLRSIDDNKLCNGSPHYRWQLILPGTSLFSHLQKITGHPTKPVNFRITRLGPGGWVKQVTITYPEHNEKSFTGEQFHILMGRHLGWNVFKSSNFLLRKDGQKWHFMGRGLGHGVGMCQWGARRMAFNGENFNYILIHYFPGTVVNLW